MATDASRRWLNDSGFLSCRIKIPVRTSHLEPDRGPAPAPAPGLTILQNHGIADSRDVNVVSASSMESPKALEATSPNPRRSNKIAEALQNMAKPLAMPLDPDAQATVTDFLDFTEYLPSDMMRSLSLIGKLDQTHDMASKSLHERTKTYGQLPGSKADPVELRRDISLSLAEAVGARTLAYAEACRMQRNVERHYGRAKNILARLQAMLGANPSERLPTPPPQKTASPAKSRGPRITLRVDGDRAGNVSEQIRVRKHRAPRISVPGEVLAPYELDYESYGSEGDSDSMIETPTSPRPPPVLGGVGGRIKLKIATNKIPKPPRPPRPSVVMGTHVRNSVAGISTSNALAKLKPPPPDAQPGSEHAPWLCLTPYELASIRKRMKKNAVWSPSDTMIARELKQRGRGLDNYRAAKANAEAAGLPWDSPVPPQLNGQTVHDEGAMSLEAVGMGTMDDLPTFNRGIKLNEAKKMKKEKQAEELAKLAAEEAEESARKMAEAAQAMKGLFSRNESAAKIPPQSSPNKRKRESEASSTTEALEKFVNADTKYAKLRKTSITSAPVPMPPPIKTNALPGMNLASALSTSSNAIFSAAIDESFIREGITTVESPVVLPSSIGSPTKVSTPILPPDTRRATRTEISEDPIALKEKETITKRSAPRGRRVEDTETAAMSRPRRTSTIVPQPNSTAPEPTPRPPTSSRSIAASIEPPATATATATIDRPRRTSTARNTPAPEPRQQNRRTKRPAPGVVTAGSEGSAAVSVGPRAGAPRKKASQKRKAEVNGQEVQLYDEVDEEGKLIDPDEPRYCVCHRVSFGEMIRCENDQCPNEWFHFECVGLTHIPRRTMKWYCFDCQKLLGVGENGEVSARSKRK